MKQARYVMLICAIALAVACSSIPNSGRSFDSVNQAVATNDVVSVRLAIDSGLDIDEYDEKGYSPLMNALEQGTGESIVRLLIAKGANPNFHENIYQRTPLMVVRRFDYETTKLLLDAGANPNSQDKWRNNSLYYIGQGVKDVKVINLLASHGGDIHNRGLDGITAFMIAAGRNVRPEILDSMLAQGIDINEADNNGWTALFYAARENKNLGIVDFLLAHGANPAIQDRLGFTAAHYANQFRKIPDSLLKKLQ